MPTIRSSRPLKAAADLAITLYKHPLVVVGHGTRDLEGRREFQALMSLVAASHSGVVECGFLELEQPGIGEAIDRAVARITACSGADVGSDGIVVLPAQLLGARHVLLDIPRAVSEAERRYPHIPIHLGPPLGQQEKIRAICRSRCEEVIDPANRDQTALLVVGRGTSQPQNTVVSRIAKSLREDLRCSWAMGCYAGIASPRLSEAFEMARRVSFRRFLVFPFFLFSGNLVKAVCEEARQFSKTYPDCEILLARHIGPDPLLRDALLEGYAETIRNRSPHVHPEVYP